MVSVDRPGSACATIVGMLAEITKCPSCKRKFDPGDQTYITGIHIEDTLERKMREILVIISVCRDCRLIGFVKSPTCWWSASPFDLPSP